MGYGKNIKKRREELGMTQDELAAACGYKSRASISKIESGATDLTQSKLAVLAKALQTEPSALLTEEDDSNTEKVFGINAISNALSKATDKIIEDTLDKFIQEKTEAYRNSLPLNLLFAENLSMYMDDDDVSHTALAKAVGVSNSAVGKWLSGSVMPRPNIQLKIADYFGIERDDLFKRTIPPKLPPIKKLAPKTNTHSVPLLGTIAAGAPILADEHVDEYIEISLDVKADFALRVQGDSMIDANIHDGDIVFIHQQPSVENGEIAAVMLIDPDTSDAVATLKRVYKTPNGLQLIPENRNYAPIIIDQSNGEGAKILGKATYYLTQAR
nr:MAG TPA: Repressor protein CI [Caudoviricetes sp.]